MAWSSCRRRSSSTAGAGRRPPDRPADGGAAAAPSCARSAPECPSSQRSRSRRSGSAGLRGGRVSFISPCVWPLVPPTFVRLGRLVLRPRRPDAARHDRHRVVRARLWHDLHCARRGRRSDRRPAREHRRTLELISGLVIIFMGPCWPAGAAACCSRNAAFKWGASPPGRSAPWSRAQPSDRLDALRGTHAGRDPGPRRPLGSRGGRRLLLAVYSLGLGVPFLLSGLLFTRGLSSLASAEKAHARCWCAPRAWC